MGNNKIYKLCEKISIGIVGLVFIIILISILLFNINNMVFAEVILYDMLPNYKITSNLNLTQIFLDNQSELVFADENNTYIKDLDDTNISIGEVEIIGLNDIIYEDHNKDEDITNNIDMSANTTGQSNSLNSELNLDIEKLKDLDYLKQNFYIIDSTTAMTSDYFNIENFLSVDLTTQRDENNPKVLIFHSHANEMFIDSDINDINEGIVGAGSYLAELLESQYNITTLHIKDEFDTNNGRVDRNGAYERMEAPIQAILSQNPSIEVVIDLHRDGVNENVHLVETINGKPTAQIMFFNGISRILQDGQLNNITNLSNPNVQTNLALSFNMQKTAMEKYDGFTRKIYIKPYRYSLHLMPKTLLVEAGAQTNTKQEIYNAMELLADIINDVLF